MRRSHLDHLKYKKTVGRPGICPKPAGGAYSAHPDPLASAAGLAALSQESQHCFGP